MIMVPLKATAIKKVRCTCKHITRIHAYTYIKMNKAKTHKCRIFPLHQVSPFMMISQRNTTAQCIVEEQSGSDQSDGMAPVCRRHVHGGT